MKVVHLSSVHPPDDNRIFKICRSVAAAGPSVTYVVPAARDDLVDGVAVKAVRRRSRRLARMFRTTWHVYRRAVQEHADVYQFHDPELIPVGLALRYIHKRAVIYDVHENVPQQILTKDYIPGWLRKTVAGGYDRLESFAARRLSAIVTANEDLNRRFAGVARLVTVHNYADDDEFRDAGESNGFRYHSGLVFHSAASERTSFPAVLRAVEMISKKVQVRLLVTGVTEAEAVAASRVSQQSGLENLESLGVLPRNEMVRRLCECAVSIVLYNQEKNHSGIRANRFYESLAAATALITPDFPEWKAAVQSIGCGIPVNPADPGAIAEALEHLLLHPDIAAEMGQRGRRAFLEMFSWKPEMRKLLQLYRDLVPDQRERQVTVAVRQTGREQWPAR